MLVLGEVISQFPIETDNIKLLKDERRHENLVAAAQPFSHSGLCLTKILSSKGQEEKRKCVSWWWDSVWVSLLLVAWIYK